MAEQDTDFRMADEMSTNGSNPFDPMASWARLSERVENQGKDIVDLRSNMNTGFQTVNSSISALSNELRSNSRTQWPAIWAALSVGVAILTGLGFMALQPIKENNARLETAMVRLDETSVSQKELEWRTARGAEDRLRSEAMLKELRESEVPRDELSRVWANYDQRFTDIQRQIDDIKQQYASTYGARDIILDLRNRLDRLEQEKAQFFQKPIN